MNEQLINIAMQILSQKLNIDSSTLQKGISVLFDNFDISKLLNNFDLEDIVSLFGENKIEEFANIVNTDKDSAINALKETLPEVASKASGNFDLGDLANLAKSLF